MPIMAFTRKWSEELRAAVLYVILDLGKTAPAATELARAGQLPQLSPGAKPIAAQPGLPLATVRDWARDERARRGKVAATSLAPDAKLQQLAGELIAVWEHEVIKTRRRVRRGAVEPDRLMKLARAGRELAALSATLAKGTVSAPGKASSAPAAAPESAGFLDALADEPDIENP